MDYQLGPCWQNCYSPDDGKFLEDKELMAIDKMEDSLAPLDDQTVALRQLITRFELCYHEADKEAEYIIESIAAGHCLEQSKERQPQRKKELRNTHRILSRWCKDPTVKKINLRVGDMSADELLSFIGEPNPFKIWQVERIVDRVTEALDPSKPYHRLALNLGDYGEPGANSVGEYYKGNQAFLEQTRKAIIHDTVDGHKSKVSLAIAIDLFMPCHWDFIGSLATILKAIGGDLHPDRSFACCGRNIKLSQLCGRMKVISNSLGLYWKGGGATESIDRDIIASLAEVTPVKQWLAASLDKTIRLHLSLPFDIELV